MAGDPPVWPIPDEEVRLAIERAWADGSWGRYDGVHGQQLEQELARLHDAGFVTLCCSGTFAVELALRGLKIGSSDEVILAGYDFPGNFRAIEATGARPVLVDVQRDGWLLDIDQLPAALNGQTRAILISHLHGGIADMPRIMNFAHKHGLAVVEDACQAPGGLVAGRIAGSWGDVGILSFGGSKLLTAGRGGAIITRQAEVHQRAKVFCQRGNNAFPLSELQAAILLPQLAKLAERNQGRRANVERLLAHTHGLPGLRPLVNRTANSAPCYYKLAWRYSAAELRDCPIDEFVAALQAEGVPVDRGFRGFARRSGRRCRKIGPLPESQLAAETTLLLHHPILLEQPARIDDLARAIAKVAGAFANRVDGPN
ncbi:MAG: aminotransferase class V-fold PLP-dependent enzyme [Planctomycetia bacterium]|nr:aminotransferase class V-fold PLP-dependent enzyme [Planctomycetia bacterium]